MGGQGPFLLTPISQSCGFSSPNKSCRLCRCFLLHGPAHTTPRYPLPGAGSFWVDDYIRPTRWAACGGFVLSESRLGYHLGLGSLTASSQASALNGCCCYLPKRLCLVPLQDPGERVLSLMLLWAGRGQDTGHGHTAGSPAAVCMALVCALS